MSPTPAAGNNVEEARAHFVFIPLMAMGHVIPAIDTAFLLCTHGALCSIVATPATAARVRPCIEQSGLDVRLLEFPLEYVSDGADNLDNIAPERLVGYFSAVALLRAPIEERLRGGGERVSCIVSDFFHPWTLELAASLGVPRLSFFVMSAFSALCEHNLHHRGGGESMKEKPDVVVPGLEKKVKLRREQVPSYFRHPCFGKFREEIDRAQADGDGIIINTFLELEPDYVRGYAAAWGKKVWTVGPVSLHHQQQPATRGEAVGTDGHCLQWLDGKEPGSVVYVSFGTISPKMEPPELLLELGLALEMSGHPFIWVLSKADQPWAESSSLLQELQKRVAGHGRGRIVRGWVPQLQILAHPAVGCFLTHAGWNSILETITAGKPVVTWPRLPDSDHHVTEKLAVDVLGIGISIAPAPSKEVIQAALTGVLRGGDEGQERRSRTRALSHVAKGAMQPGGSSHANLCDLVKRFTI